MYKAIIVFIISLNISHIEKNGLELMFHGEICIIWHTCFCDEQFFHRFGKD
jgi:hypothetical protein